MIYPGHGNCKCNSKTKKRNMYETCKDCLYYYGEINQCMYGEEDVPNNLEKKCEVKND